MNTPSPAEVSRLLLELHEFSNDASHHDVQSFALARLGALVPFDSGILAMGTIQGGVPHGHDVVTHNISPSLMASWEEMKHEDRVAQWAFTHPGETGNFAVSGPIFDGCPIARAHCARWRLEHVLCTCLVSAPTGLYWVMSTYRSDADRPFSEVERSTVEMLVPHIFAVSRRARLRQLRLRASLPLEDQPQVLAVPEGLILEADPAFAELLRLGFPGWRGPTLPPELIAEFAQGKATKLHRGQVVIDVTPAAGVFLVRARKARVADSLTERERAIAEAFSLGQTHKEVATSFGLSPNTVRRHLANIYEKLGISSKAELDRMIQE